jgi:hypothetical protein
MSEPASSRQQGSGRNDAHNIDVTESEGEPSSLAHINIEKIELKPLRNKNRSTAWDWFALLLGALIPLIVTVISYTQIPGKPSTSLETILIIVGGLVVVFGLGLLALALYRRFRVRRLERLESRLSGSDLHAINLFVTRELELLSTLGEDGIK